MTEEKMEKASDRILVESFKVGSAVAEVWESRSRDNVKVYFDIRLSREFLGENAERRRGPFIQQRDIPELVIAIMQAQQYVTRRHTEIRRSRYSETYDEREE